MPTAKFKTNINCGGCIKAVTPFLNKTAGIVSWNVDTDNPDKILSVEYDGTDAGQIKKEVEKAGFTAEVAN